MKSQRRILGVSVFLFLVFGISLRASGDGAPLKMTLQESIDLAKRQSVIVRSAAEGVAAAESGRKGARSDFLPTLSTSYGYTRLDKTPSMTFQGREVVTGTRDNYNWSLDLTQPVFTGGKILRNYEISELGVERARAEEEATLQDVVQEVKASYFNILKAERSRAVARQSVAQLESHRDTAQSFYEVGIIPKNDLLYAEVQLARGRQSLVRAENAVALAKARFNTVLRRPVNAPVEVEDILVKSLESCLAIARDARPEVRMYRITVEQAEKSVGLAKGDYFPTMSLSANYSRFGDSPGVSGSPYDDGENWSLMALASWDLWEWGKTKYNVDASRSRLSQARDALLNLTDRIDLEVKDSYLYVQEAEKHIFVAEKAIEQAEENFRINTERYREQVATSTDVIDAETLLTETKSDYFNALSDYNIALSRLERSVGIVYPDSIFTAAVPAAR
ncbi:MAG TPA: TolC family protein [Syntrophales bacterium]|nr:TolC family protein [Syntrophales bacterium]